MCFSCFHIINCTELSSGAGDRPVMHCPKCDSHFVIEVSESTGSISARSSQTMTGLNLAGDKISRFFSFKLFTPGSVFFFDLLDFCL